MKDMIFKTFETEIKQDSSARRMTFKISTGAVDRDGDIIEPKGWETDSYMQNPCVLFAHDYKSLPVAKAIKLTKADNSLIAVAEFPDAGVYPFADTVYDMLKGGFLNATSVGFKPLDFEPLEAKDGGGIRHKKQQLLEFSIVPVPANQEALVIARDGSRAEEARAHQEPILAWCKKFIDGYAQKQASESTTLTAADLAALAVEVKRLITPEPKGLAGCTRMGGCPTNEDGSAENCAMADCPLKKPGPVGGAESEPKSVIGEIIFEDENDYVFGITPEGVVKIARDATREVMRQYVNQLIKEQIDYARGRIRD